MKAFIVIMVTVIVFTGFMYLWDGMKEEPKQVKRKRGRNPRQTAGQYPGKMAQAGADLKQKPATPQPGTMNTDRGTAGQNYNGSGKVKPEPVKEKFTYNPGENITVLTPERKQPERGSKGRGRG